MRTLFCAAVVLAACGTGSGPMPPASTALDIDDVSFLYPLPTQLSDKDKLLQFDSAGAQGQLLPRAYFDQVLGAGDGGNSDAIDETLTADAIYSGMRVISARVDPAFPTDTMNPPTLRQQIRLVAQIVEEQDGGVIGTRDGTLHLFYNMSQAQFAEITEGLGKLKQIAGDDTKGKPLDVHPTMKQQGLDGTYAAALSKLITDHCGEQNLFRVAFMVAKQDGKSWKFGAYLNKSGTMQEDVIPRTGASQTDLKKEQTQTENGTEDNRNTSFDPVAVDSNNQPDDLPTLLVNQDLQLADDMTVSRAVTEALHIENPDKETPQTIDCASCHAASRALTTAKTELQLNMTQYATDAYAAPSRFNTARVDGVGQNPFAQRAFGYFGNLTAFSQRTINESAAIADKLSPK
jgi:hypothetical protein